MMNTSKHNILFYKANTILLHKVHGFNLYVDNHNSWPRVGQGKHWSSLTWNMVPEKMITIVASNLSSDKSDSEPLFMEHGFDVIHNDHNV